MRINDNIRTSVKYMKGLLFRRLFIITMISDAY